LRAAALVNKSPRKRRAAQLISIAREEMFDALAIGCPVEAE
jgi:hypothetical protein